MIFNTIKAYGALLAITLSCGLSAQIFLPTTRTLADIKTDTESKNGIIAWDLHGVVLAKDKKSKASSIIKGLPGGAISYLSLGFSKITGVNTKASKANDEINKLSQTVDLSGEAYAHIFKKHGLASLAKIADDSSRAYVPMPGMETLIKELDTKGHTQRFASNIGFESLQTMKTQFKTKHKNTVLDLIQPGKVVDYRKYGKPQTKAVSVDPTTVASVGKPDLKFYEEFNATYNSDNSKTIIFIDDKIDNIKQANKKGWVGIHFNRKLKNSVAQLRADFKQLGIL